MLLMIMFFSTVDFLVTPLPTTTGPGPCKEKRTEHQLAHTRFKYYCTTISMGNMNIDFESH